MVDSADKMLQCGFSHIRDALTQLVSVSRLMGMELLIVSLEYESNVLEVVLKDVIESIRISIDFEQRKRLPHIP